MLHSFLVYQSDDPVFLDNTNYFYTTLYFDPCIAATVANDVATANVISKSGSANKKDRQWFNFISCEKLVLRFLLLPG